MFRLFNKHHAALYKWAMVFFLGIVSIGMILVFTPLGGGGSMQQSSADVLASVGGTQITMQDLRTQIDGWLRNAPSESTSKMVPIIAGTMLDDMVLRQGMATDRMEPAGVYFGTSGGALFASVDEGESWSCLAQHLPSISSVETLTLDA